MNTQNFALRIYEIVYYMSLKCIVLIIFSRYDLIWHGPVIMMVLC